MSMLLSALWIAVIIAGIIYGVDWATGGKGII